MKDYKNVEMFAKNAPAGSYAAGCPSNHRGRMINPNNPISWKHGMERDCVIDSEGRHHFSEDRGEFDICRHCELFN